MRRALRPIAALSALLSLAACGSLLGIEDVHEGPAPGSAAGASGDSVGGASNSAAGTANGGAATAGTSSSNGGRANPNGGDSNPSGGTGDPNGGSAGKGQAGGNSAGNAGSGGAPTVGGAVTGHVIDFWGHKISGVPVEIGGKKVTTDVNGAFTFADVADEYDVSLVIQYVSTVTQTHGYVYQGLTRRDPTLQVYTGTATLSANLDTNFKGTDKSVTGTRTLTFAMGGDDGNLEAPDAPKAGSYGLSVKWVGPLTTVEQAHALVLQNNDVSGLPEGYFAYATTSVALVSTTTNHSMADLDLTPPTTAIATSTLSGTVTPAGFATRLNTISLRFASGATIQLANTLALGNNFSFLVPTISNASVTFAAAEGCTTNADGCAIVHKDGLTGGTANVAVTIPTPIAGLTLTPDAAVDANTQFSFAADATNTGPYVSIMANHDTLNDRLYVITNKRPFKLPKVVNGSYVLAAGAPYSWQIETHGKPTSVDQMTGPTGFIDSFSTRPADIEPRGSRPGDGTYTFSVPKTLMIAK